MIQHTAKLPFGYEARFVWHDDQSWRVAWSPDLPRIRKERAWRKFRAAYNEARRQFFHEVAGTVGGNILILDTDGEMESVMRPTLQ